MRSRIRAVQAGVLGLLVGSCLEPPPFSCSDDAVCVLNNVQGTCDVPTGTCLYSGPECPSGLRNASGECVVPTGPISTSSSTTSTTSDAEEDSESSGNAMDTGGSTWATTGSVIECGMGSDDITVLGEAQASSVFEGYPAFLAVDNDLVTSWFSTGPEAMGLPIGFTWTVPQPRCIEGLTLDGNEYNANPDWREGFGFSSVSISVLDDTSDVAFETTRQLPGTPDPHIEIETGGVVGTRVVLLFDGPENPFGSGFAELRVYGQ